MMNNGTNSSNPGTSVQEYSIRVPKNVKKKFHVMRFNSVLNVDFTKWTQVKMERENNMREFKTHEEDMPKFGAGSEFGREAREEARRKKCGIIMKKYKVEDQPWILKSGGKTGKKFKGSREGGVGENAAYYVFTHATDGGIEAYPLCEWYNFHPIQRYKALSAEEAEQEFGRRNKVMNYFNLMLRKRLKNEDDVDLEEGEEGKPRKGKKKKDSGDFKISEMDEWLESGDENSDSDDDEQAEKKDKKDKKKPGAKGKPKKKKKKGSDESAFEESDDGDEEGRELDYISDSSESESDSDKKAVEEMKGVAEETALRKLLTSDEDDEEEQEDKDKKAEGEKKEGEEKDEKKEKKKKKTKVKSEKKTEEDSSSDSSGDSSDSDPESKDKKGANGVKNEPDNTPDKQGDRLQPPSKKQKLEVPNTPLNYGSGDNSITEEAVRRYLMRKPMTTTELLQKFKGRKTGLSSEQLVNVMTQILKRINPTKQMIKGKMYLSIKPT